MSKRQRDIYQLTSTYFNDPSDSISKNEIERFRSQSRANDILYRDLEAIWQNSSKAGSLQRFNFAHSSNSFKNRLALSQETENSSIKDRHQSFFKSPLFRWAAAVLIFATVTVSIYQVYKSDDVILQHTSAGNLEVSPSGKQATLTLANGKKVVLSEAMQGELALERGVRISKSADGQIVYQVVEIEQQSLESGSNTIETPKGGMWQVKLPDGTEVWLNAESALTYPVAFSKHSRNVVLQGEAYFEVAKDKNRPFIVKTDKQALEVLGTKFCVNAYDGDLVGTTLMEGSVRILSLLNNSAAVLKPGEHSSLSTNGIKIEKVDVEDALDWKNGYFLFNNEKQQDIMKRLSRWYSMNVEYADAEAREVVYYGIVSREENLSKILKKFELTGDVKFVIDQNKIVVHKVKSE